MDGAGGGCERKSSPSVSYGAAVRRGTHTQKNNRPTTTAERNGCQESTGPDRRGFRKMPVGIFSEAGNGSASEERQKERMETGPGHACTDSGDGFFFQSRSLAHPVPCDYAQAWKVERNDPSRLPFPFVQSRRSVRPTAGI